MYFFNN